jgi:hypothetical protein
MTLDKNWMYFIANLLFLIALAGLIWAINRILIQK